MLYRWTAISGLMAIATLGLTTPVLAQGSDVCALVESAASLSPVEQEAIGRRIAGIIADLALTDVGAADVAQNCVALAAPAVISGYQAESSAAVADIGDFSTASDQ